MNYDDYSSLFAVYDGHGGHEVAAYTAKKLPNYIKCRKDYRMGNIEQGLTEAFVEFDRTLTEQNLCWSRIIFVEMSFELSEFISY